MAYWVEANEKFITLFETKKWRIDKYENDSGSCIYHKVCKQWTAILEINNAKCCNGRCQAKMPNEIQTIYILHNWHLIDSPAYFNKDSDGES